MNIYTLNKTGRFHDIHTEDHVFLYSLEHGWLAGAVMDGCSSGKETYFASTLLGKLLCKACKMLLHLNRIDEKFRLDEADDAFIGKFLLEQVFDDLKKAHQLLDTDLFEMLSTLLLLIYHEKNKSAWINISGDGLIVHNQDMIEIDQNNIPDYMAYHLDIKFEQWIQQFSKTYVFENQHDLSISTDGIFKFFSISERQQKSIDPVHYLLIDDSHKGSEEMLKHKFKILEEQYGLIPYDDLGMIRIIN
jgi:hypothetical protein